MKSDFHSFRSNVHFILHFLFGIVMCLYGREGDWNWWEILAVGVGFGPIDEGIKVRLPTREFDPVDLVKDWVGIIFAIIKGKLWPIENHSKTIDIGGSLWLRKS